jgi:hypothetical protein
VNLGICASWGGIELASFTEGVPGFPISFYFLRSGQFARCNCRGEVNRTIETFSSIVVRTHVWQNARSVVTLANVDKTPKRSTDAAGAGDRIPIIDGTFAK